MSSEARKRVGSIKAKTGSALNDHLADPFQIHLKTPERIASPAAPALGASNSCLTNWIVEPRTSFKLLVLPVILYLNWEFVSLFVQTNIPNPFSKIFLLSGYIPDSQPDDPRYQKTWWDLIFLAYYVIFFSFIRQSVLLYIATPLARYFRFRRASKVTRFGEQAYAFLYFMVFGAWGCRIMSTLPTFWFNTPEFWKGYPHWDMKAELKFYYLTQFSHWLQELLVVTFGLEKARKDYMELVVHHIVTLWLIGGSYLINMTHIGNAVYVSMDIPDVFLAFSKLLNYIQWNTAKIYSFGFFFLVWSYFRHYLNFWILWSVWFEIGTIPETAQRWSWSDGVYLPRWMRYNIFSPLLLLQFLNLFWYSLMIKILIRAIKTAQAEDDRSDDEDGDRKDAVEEKEACAT